MRKFDINDANDFMMNDSDEETISVPPVALAQDSYGNFASQVERDQQDEEMGDHI